MSGLTSVLWTLQKCVALIFNKKLSWFGLNSHFTLFSQDIHFRSYNLTKFKYICLSPEPPSLAFRVTLRGSFTFTLTGPHAFLSYSISQQYLLTEGSCHRTGSEQHSSKQRDLFWEDSKLWIPGLSPPIVPCPYGTWCPLISLWEGQGISQATIFFFSISKPMWGGSQMVSMYLGTCEQHDFAAIRNLHCHLPFNIYSTSSGRKIHWENSEPSPSAAASHLPFLLF